MFWSISVTSLYFFWEVHLSVPILFFFGCNPKFPFTLNIELKNFFFTSHEIVCFVCVFDAKNGSVSNDIFSISRAKRLFTYLILQLVSAKRLIIYEIGYVNSGAWFMNNKNCFRIRLKRPNFLSTIRFSCLCLNFTLYAFAPNLYGCNSTLI